MDTTAIEAMLQKITPGEWWYDGYCYVFARQPDGNCYPMITDFDTDEAYLTRMRGVGAGLVENGQQDANANFIAAAPTIVRSLLDQNGFLTAEVKRLQEERNQLAINGAELQQQLEEARIKHERVREDLRILTKGRFIQS